MTAQLAVDERLADDRLRDHFVDAKREHVVDVEQHARLHGAWQLGAIDEARALGRLEGVIARCTAPHEELSLVHRDRSLVGDGARANVEAREHDHRRAQAASLGQRLAQIAQRLRMRLATAVRQVESRHTHAFK